MPTLVLVRHGATEWNALGRCQGRTDVPLSDRGRKQAEALRERLAAYAFDACFASPLSRARDTARIASGGLEPAILPGLAEIDRGDWEGLPMPEAKARWADFSERWYDDPAGLSMPGGEEFDALWDRAGRVVEEFVRTDAECVLAGGHKAINRVVIARALGRPSKGVWDIPQPQACVSVLVRENGTWKAEILGDVSHLPAELRSDS
jgi:broad specificity phosphatase PhoE